MRRNHKRGHGRSDSKQQQVSRDYLSGLKDYWAGRPRTAIEHISKVLADNPDDQSKFSLYRLWIEVLADDGDKRALRSLAQHLYLRSQEDDEPYETYMALRGLIHLELDEIEATQLMLKALVNSETSDPYIAELHQRFEERLSDEPVVNLLADIPPKHMRDYFHWEVMTRNYYVNNQTADMDRVLHKIQQLFPDSPLPRVYRMHQAFASEKFDVAFQTAKSLYQDYPGVSDYEVFQAFAALKLDRSQDAHQVLARHVSIFGQGDVDVMTLLSASMHRMMKTGSELVTREQAVETLKATTALLHENDLPSRFTQQALYDIDEDLGASAEGAEIESAEKSAPASNRVWLAKLTPAQYHELQTSDEASLQMISRPLGTEAQPGDLCFLATESYEGAKRSKSQSWRIAGIYTVVSNPEVDPFHGLVSMLRLVQRPGISIPVDIQPLDRPAGAKSRYSAAKVGVYELDQTALGIIAEAANQRLQRGRENRELFDELARVRQIS